MAVSFASLRSSRHYMTEVEGPYVSLDSRWRLCEMTGNLWL